MRQCRAEVDEAELDQWAAYATLEPFGEERADLRQAITSCIIANVNRKRGAPPYVPSDFMLFREKPVQDLQQQMQMLDSFATQANKQHEE